MKYYGIQNEVKSYINRLQSEQGIAVSASVVKTINDRVEALKKSGVWSRFSLGFNDVDGDAYLTRAGVTDPVGRCEVLWFTRGMKALDLWNNMVCWSLRSYQNAGTSSTVYSLGGLGIYNGTMTNSPSWSTDGIVFSNNTQYIQYSPNFTVDFTKAGYNIHCVWSCLGVPIVAGEDLKLFSDSTTNNINNYITTAVGGGTTWFQQSRNYGSRYFGNTQASYIGNVVYTWIADTRSMLLNNIDSGTSSNATSTPSNGTYTIRSTGRGSATTTPTSRISYLLVFSPNIQMSVAKNLLVHTLTKSTIGNGLGLP